MADGKPTLHHLNNSQSQRILWLLEELEIPYNVSLHTRLKTARAPPELAETHPLGKAPQLVTADGRLIAESSAIAAYLITTYDTAKKFQGDGAAGGSNDWIRDESLTSFAGATMGPVDTMKIFFDAATMQTPFLIRPLVRLVTGAVDRMFTAPELKAMLAYLEAQLGGQDYFMGNEPGRADFMLSFPMDMAADNGWVENWATYPGLRAWRDRCRARDAWKRGLEKGNGYNMALSEMV